MQLKPFADAEGLAVAVDLTVDSRGIARVSFTVAGAADGVIWPAADPAPGFRDELWKSTCFEVFIGGADGRYLEWNVSPSGNWAVYGFSAYRVRDPRLALDAARPGEIATTGGRGLRFAIPLPAVRAILGPPPWKMQPTAVLASRNAATSYWAPVHPDARPDFHRLAHLGDWTPAVSGSPWG